MLIHWDNKLAYDAKYSIYSFCVEIQNINFAIRSIVSQDRGSIVRSSCAYPSERDTNAS